MSIFLVHPDYNSENDFHIFYILANSELEAQKIWAKSVIEDNAFTDDGEEGSAEDLIAYIQEEESLTQKVDTSPHVNFQNALRRRDEKDNDDMVFISLKSQRLDHEDLIFNFIHINCPYYRRELYETYLRQNMEVIKSRVGY